MRVMVMVGCVVLAACGKKADDKSAAGSAGSGGSAAKTAAAPDEPGFEQSDKLGFCDKGTHVEENIVLSGGDPYAMLVRGTCHITFKHCTMIASEAADQPAVQVMEGGVARFEGCTLKSLNPKFPALWVSAGGKATIVKTRLESAMKNSIDVWENSSVEYDDSSWTGEPNVRETGTFAKVGTAPAAGSAAAGSAAPAAAGDTPLYAGSYKTSEGAMTLKQTAADPTTVSGVYAKGKISCKATGAQLDCKWVEPGASGRARFKRADSGNMTGTWGADSAATGGGSWTCTLLKAGALE